MKVFSEIGSARVHASQTKTNWAKCTPRIVPSGSAAMARWRADGLTDWLCLRINCTFLASLAVGSEVGLDKLEDLGVLHDDASE